MQYLLRILQSKRSSQPPMYYHNVCIHNVRSAAGHACVCVCGRLFGCAERRCGIGGGGGDDLPNVCVRFELLRYAADTPASVKSECPP